MSTTTVKSNIIYGLGEGGLVADATMLTYALRWANRAQRTLFTRYRFKHLRTRSMWRTTHGQATYQAPSDFMGFLVIKDESNANIINQLTPEEFNREYNATQVTEESITCAATVTLANTGIVQYSETVTNSAGTTTYTRDTDYSMNYTTGVLTNITLTVGTTYLVSYLYRVEGKPTDFCLEYDSTNKKYVFRLGPVPDAEYVGSILYSASPSALSGSVDPLWDQLELSLEAGGIYYGSLEIIEDAQKRQEFKQEFETTMQALIQMDQEMVERGQQIKLVLRSSDYDG